MPIAIDLNQISPHKFMQRTAIFKSTSGGASRSFNEHAYESVWLRLWAHNEGKWRVAGWPKPDAIGEADAVRYWFPNDRNQRMLQLGGPKTPWTMVSLPASARLEVTARPTANQVEAGLTVTVATDNNLVEALLGYLSIGALRNASLIDEQMEELLRGGLADPAVTVVGGYYLLRVSDLDRLDHWPTRSVNPDEGIGWQSDVAVIRAWQLIREQQEATKPSPARLAIAREKLLEAVEYGAPIYTEGLRLLVAGLKLFDFEAAGEDQPVRDGLALIRPFAAASDIGT